MKTIKNVKFQKNVEHYGFIWHNSLNMHVFFGIHNEINKKGSLKLAVALGLKQNICVTFSKRYFHPGP